MKSDTRRIMAFTCLAAFILLIAAQLCIVVMDLTVNKEALDMLETSSIVLFTIISTMKDFYFRDDIKGEDDAMEKKGEK